MKASDLIGKKVLRTKPVKTSHGEDGSYTHSVIEITDVTDNHIFYLSGDYKGILNHYWIDDNWTEYKEISHERPPERAWTEYKEISHERPPERARHNYSPLWVLYRTKQSA